MKHSPAFTLFEVLISLTISAFILLALMQAYHGACGFLEKSRMVMIDNRKICLLFNQLEKDLSTAFIPMLQKEIIPTKENKAEAQKSETPADARDRKKKTLDELTSFFLGTEGDGIGKGLKYNDRDLKVFGRLTFICANPLRVYGNSVSNLVRVAYELKQDKTHGDRDHECFKLIRKEAHDLKNTKMKVSEFDHEKLAKHDLDEQILIEGIKNIYFEYITFKEETAEEIKAREQKDVFDKMDGKEKKKEELRSFTWGEKPYSKGFVPQRIEITVVLWKKNFSGEHIFHMMVPIFSYPTEYSDEIKKQLQDQPIIPGGTVVPVGTAPGQVAGQAVSSSATSTTVTTVSGI